MPPELCFSKSSFLPDAPGCGQAALLVEYTANAPSYACSCGCREPSRLASWQVKWELAQLQICSSFLSEFVILDVLGKSAVWETIQGALL